MQYDEVLVVICLCSDFFVFTTT